MTLNWTLSCVKSLKSFNHHLKWSFPRKFSHMYNITFLSQSCHRHKPSPISVSNIDEAGTRIVHSKGSSEFLYGTISRGQSICCSLLSYRPILRTQSRIFCGQILRGFGLKYVGSARIRFGTSKLEDLQLFLAIGIREPTL